MEELLTSYLYQYKTCPLPNVGSLIYQPGSALAQQAEKLMQAPVAVVEFSTKQTNADGLLQYISSALKIDKTAASLTLDHFCKKILQLNSGSQMHFANAGVFKTDDNGQLCFETAHLSSGFLTDVIAERVIHPDAKHSILVGDTHTHTGAMTEMLFTGEKERISSWIWWATGFAAVALLAIVFYFANATSSGFGNSSKINAPAVPSTYSTGSK